MDRGNSRNSNLNSADKIEKKKKSIGRRVPASSKGGESKKELCKLTYIPPLREGGSLFGKALLIFPQ